MTDLMVLKIVNTHGLKGEVRALYYADGPLFFDSLEFVSDKNGNVFYLESVRPQKGALLVKFRGIDTPEAAEALRGRELFVKEEQLGELPEGQYYIADLISLEVAEEGKEPFGCVTDVISAGSGEILGIRLTSGKKAMIPFVEAFVKTVDREKKRITVELIEGLIDEI